MSPRPLMIDLFCKAGGAATGYHRAGFDLLGVDIEPQPHYPFPFVQADALEFIAAANLSSVAAIHASPPCQAYSAMKGMWNARIGHPDLLAPTRAALQATGRPWGIEHVLL